MWNEISGKLRKIVGKKITRRLLGLGSWMMGGAAFQGVVAFLSNIALVRLLTPEEFGRFAMIQANVALVGALVNFKIGDLVLRASEERLRGGQLSAFGTAQYIELVLIGIGAVVLLIVTNLLSWEALVLVVSTLAANWLAVQTSLYERRFEYQSISVLETSSHFASHVITVASAAAGLGASALYIREAIRLIVKGMGLQWMGELRRLPARWLSVEEWKELFGEFKGFWIDVVLEQSFERIIIILVGAFGGQRITGFFFQARRLAMIPHQLLEPIVFRMNYNYLSHHAQGEDIEAVVLRNSAATTVVLLLVVVSILLWADPVVPWLFGEDWTAVVPLFIAMFGVVVGMSILRMIQAYYMATGQMRPFIVVGRSVQYASIGTAAVLVWSGVASVGSGLSLGLSASYLLPSIALAVLIAVVRRSEKRGVH